MYIQFRKSIQETHTKIYVQITNIKTDFVMLYTVEINVHNQYKIQPRGEIATKNTQTKTDRIRC